MGKGSNASKINRARAEAAKRDAVKPGGGGASGMAERKGTNALGVKCVKCMTAFMASQGDAQLREHCESKHPKNTFAECFPERAAEAAAAGGGGGE